MNPYTQPNAAISKAFLIALNAAGQYCEADINEGITLQTGFKDEGLMVVNRAMKALTALAIDQIHMSIRGNPSITRDEARTNIRDAAFYLTDEAFERLFNYAQWCVAKGC
jgi:hypothetical protein